MTKKQHPNAGQFLTDKLTPNQVKAMRKLLATGATFDEHLTHRQKLVFGGLELKGMIKKQEDDYGFDVWVPLYTLKGVALTDKGQMRQEADERKEQVSTEAETSV